MNIEDVPISIKEIAARKKAYLAKRDIVKLRHLAVGFVEFVIESKKDEIQRKREVHQTLETWLPRTETGSDR